jgi:hypothetical protein
LESDFLELGRGQMVVSKGEIVKSDLSVTGRIYLLGRYYITKWLRRVKRSVPMELMRYGLVVCKIYYYRMQVTIL